MLILAILLACARSDHPIDPASIRVARCVGWVEGCLLPPDRRLVVWVGDAGQTRREVIVQTGDQQVQATWEPELSGYVAEIGPVTGEIMVRRGADQVQIPARPPPPQATIDEVRTWTEAQWAAAEEAAGEATDPLLRAEIHAGLAHHLDQAKDLEAGAVHALAAREAWLEAGRGDLWPHAAFLYAARRVSAEHWLTDVRARIADAREHLTPWWDDHAYLDFVEARLLKREGDLRRSAELARRAAAAFHYIDPRFAGPARAELAEISRRAGRHADSVRTFAELYEEAPVDKPCVQALRLGNYGFALAEARRDGFTPPEDPLLTRLGTDPTTILAQTFTQVWQRCEQADGVVALENWLWARLDDGEVPTSIQPELTWLRALVEGEAPGTDDQRLVLDLERLTARVAMASGRPAEALAALERAEAAAEVVDRGEGRLDVAASQAEALTALGRHEEALERYRSAHELAWVTAALVALGGGRDTFLASWQHRAAGHVELLIQLGRTAEAFEVARDLRAAMLDNLVRSRRLAADDPQTVAQRAAILRRYADLRSRQERAGREAWALRDRERAARASRVQSWEKEALASIDALLDGPVASDPTRRRAPEPGEVLLSWFPTRRGTLVFVAKAGSDTPDAEVVALGPFAGPPIATVGALRPHLAGVQRIVLLPSGSLREVDLQWERAQGQALIELAPVVWSLDLGLPPAPGGEGALVASDARGDLPWARWEGAQVAAALTRQALPVEHLRGTTITRAALMERFATTGLLHVAGHGQAGKDTLEAELILADDGALTVGDVLSAGRGPARVVLSGCETARTLQTDVETLGLGQAFVLAGANAVVASVRPVDDEVTAVWMTALYEAGFATGDPAQAFRAASLAVAWTAPGTDIGAFRLLVP